MLKINNYLFLCLFFSSSLYSKVISFDVTSPKYKKYSYESTCTIMGQGKKLLLIEAHDLSSIDCMGEVVKVSEFCLQVLTDKDTFLRGLVDKENRQVICHLGEAAKLIVSCQGNTYCQDKNTGCKKLNSIFAANLDYIHGSIQQDEKILSCYFSNKDVLSLDR